MSKFLNLKEVGFEDEDIGDFEFLSIFMDGLLVAIKGNKRILTEYCETNNSFSNLLEERTSKYDEIYKALKLYYEEKGIEKNREEK